MYDYEKKHTTASLRRRGARRSLVAVASVLAVSAAGTATANPRVQAPSLAKPQRGSVAGAYASVAFETADANRGSFSLPAPFAGPEERGGLQAGVFPTYAPDAGVGPWGMGWLTSLSLRRWSATTDLSYDNDELIGPWGRMTRGSDGAWYPVGLLQTVKVVDKGAALVATTPDGTRWTFGAQTRTDTGRGTYEWYLDRVEATTGETTHLRWDGNASGAHFLQAVDYGGWGDESSYRIEFAHDMLPTPFRDFRAGVELLMDRRVQSVRVLVQNRDTGELVDRWSYALGYDEDPWGPGFYLTSVQRTFASGAQEPPFRYEYDLGAETVPAGAFRPVPELNELLAAFGADVIQPHRASLLDVDLDGRIDLEIGTEQTLLRRTDDGFEVEPLPSWSADAHYGCRPPASPWNEPRTLARMSAEDEEPRVVYLEGSWWGNTSSLFVCDREGQVLDTAQLNGYWAFDGNTRLVDVNRDNRPEILRVEPGAYTVVPNESSGDLYSFGAETGGVLEPMVFATATWLTDFNGDGLGDLVALDGGQLVVWSGLGNFEFESRGATYEVHDIDGLVTGLDGASIYFADANKDGLSDLLVTRDFMLTLYVNDGYRLAQRRVPAFERLDPNASEPVVADFAASGDAEISLTDSEGVKSMALSDAATGLLRSADDGKGTVVSFAYGRGPARPGVEYRAAVVTAVTVESSGYEPLGYYYEYEEPVAHSRNRYLIGFDSVRRYAPQTAEEVSFHNDDEVAGLPLATAIADIDTPSFYRVASSVYREADYQGLRWLQLKQRTEGYRSYGGGDEAVEVTTFEYDGLCPTATRIVRGDATLVTSSPRASVPELGDALHCLSSEISISGIHLDGTPDFSTRESYSYNARGQLATATAHGEQGDLLMQTVKYDDLGRVTAVAAPGRGETSVAYAGRSRLVERVVAPDGVATEVANRDPVTDAAGEIATARGALTYSEYFDHDGFERLAARWDSASGGSKSAPLEVLEYDFATAAAPGAISARELVDAAGGVYRDSVELVTAAGENVASVARLPDGWQVDGLRKTDKNKLVVKTLRRQRLGRNPVRVMPDSDTRGDGDGDGDGDGARSVVDYDELYAGAVELSVTEVSGFGHEVSKEEAIAEGVDRTVDFTVSLDSGEIVVTATENDSLVTQVAVDPSGVILWSENQLGERTEFDYDASGRLVGVALADGTTHRVYFDGYGRPERVVRDEIGSIVYAYDATSSHIESRTWIGTDGERYRKTEYEYDDIGRVVNESHTDLTTGDTRTYEFEYDTSQLGELAAVRSDGYQRSYEYDALGRPSEVETSYTGWLRVVETAGYFADGSTRWTRREVYDAEDELIDDNVQGFDYDSYGRVATMTVNGAPLATYAYGAEGEVASLTLSNGDAFTFDYDSRTKNPSGYARSGASSMAVGWAFDERGLIAREDLSVGSDNWSRVHEYDARGYLVVSTGRDGGSAYQYSNTGMPTRIEDVHGVRDLALARDEEGAILTAGDAMYVYDALGRVVQKQDLALTYGPNGHLKSATRGDDVFSYAYDESGNRVAKRVNGVIVAGFVDGSYLTDDGLYTPVYAAGQLIGVLFKGELVPAAADGKGTVFGDEDGTARSASPYGARAESPALAAIVDYAGKGYDADLGTVRMGVRDYDPAIGQFHTPDPLFFETLDECVDSPVECNLYGYAGNNPVSHIDPSGYGFGSWVSRQAGRTWRGAKSAGRFAGGVAKGAGKAAWGTVKGTYEVVRHPIRTAKAVGHAVTHPRETARAVYQSGKAAAKAIASGDPEAIGAAVFEVGATFVGVGAVAKISKVDKLAKTSRLARVARAGLCFAEGTVVETVDGPKRIERVRPGDLVLSKNEETGEVSYQRVVRLSRNHDREVLKATFIDDHGRRHVLLVTPEHPFWNGRRWVPIADLVPGARVASAEGELTLESLVSDGVHETVFNFEVESTHTYFVGDALIWVHNWCAGASLRGKSLKWIKKQKPKGWRTVRSDNGKGWKWLDKSGEERLRFTRPSGKNGSASKWSRDEVGYFRWNNAKGDFLDADGKVVPNSAPDFQERTHIPYEGPR